MPDPPETTPTDPPPAPDKAAEAPPEDTILSESAEQKSRLQEAVELFADQVPDPRADEDEEAPEDTEDPPAEDGDDTPAEEAKPAEKAPPEPEPPKDPAAEEDKAEPPASLSDLRELAQKAREERAKKADEAKATEQATADATELQRLRLENDRVRAAMQQIQTDPLAALSKLTGRSKLEAFDEITKIALNEQASPTPAPKDDTRAEIEKLRAEIRERDEAASRQAQIQQAREAQDKATAAWVGYSADPEKWPFLSTEPEASRAALGQQIAREMMDAGLPVAFEQVAGYAERELAAQFERMSARKQGATADGAPNGKPTDKDPGADAGSKSGRKKAAKTLTNDQAAKRSRPRQNGPASRDDRLRAAIRELK